MTGNWDFLPAPPPPRNHQVLQMCGTLGSIEEQRSHSGSSSKNTKFHRPSRIPRLVTRNKPTNTELILNQQQRAKAPHSVSHDKKSSPLSLNSYNNWDCAYSTEYENLVVGHFMPISALTNNNYNALRPQNGQTTRLSHFQPPSASTAHPDQLTTPEAVNYVPNTTLSPFSESTKENIAQISSDGPQNLLPRSQDDLAVLSSEIVDSVLANDAQSDSLCAQVQDNATDFLSSYTPSISDLYAYLQEEQTFANQQDTWNRYSVLPPLTANDGNMSPSSTISWFSASRSSFTGRGRKRSHSISPLSAELNTIIRTSPTSLIYLPPSSRCSQNSSSPQPGEKPGCYGHLSARNSSTSPRSSSSTSGRRISIPFSHSVEPFLLQDTSNLCILQQQGTLKKELQNISCAYPPHYPFTIPPPLQNGRPPPPSYDQYMAERLSKGNMLQKPAATTKSCNNTSIEEKNEQSKLHLICEWIDCGCTFEEMSEFVRHIEKAHVDQKKGDDFTCYWKDCPRKQSPFNARYKLLNHMRVHSGEKPHKCEVAGCARAFSRQENLKIHLRSHTGERPYVCSYEGCGRTFTNPSDRKKHEKTHQEAKPYACQYTGCDKRYTDPSSLRKHAKKHVSKSEHTRKKIRGKNEVDSELLEDCIKIQPVRFCLSEENSPTDQRADSGIGRSPRTSHPGSTTDIYLGVNHANSQSNPSDSTNHTSPGSHRSNSPLGDINEWEETCFITSPSSKVPILPPIIKSPEGQIPNNTQRRPVSWCTTHEDLIRYKSGLPLSDYENTVPRNNFSASFTIAPARNVLCKPQPARCQSNLDNKNNSFNPASISLTFDVGLYTRQDQFS